MQLTLELSNWRCRVELQVRQALGEEQDEQ